MGKGGILDSRLRGNGLSLWGGWGRGHMQCAPFRVIARSPPLADDEAISAYSLARRGTVRLGGGRRHFAPTSQRRTPTYPICRFLLSQESIMSILMLTTKKENSAGALSPASAGRGQRPYPKCHCESFFKEGRRSNLRVLVGTKGCGEIATAFLRRASQ